MNKNEKLAAAPAASGGDYPECSGDPASCPENEGHGCCKPNPKCSCPSGDGSLSWPCQEHPPSGASVSERARALLAASYRESGDKAQALDVERRIPYVHHAIALRAVEQALTQQHALSSPRQEGDSTAASTQGIDPFAGITYHDEKGPQGTLDRLRRYAKEGDNRRNLLGQTMNEAAHILSRLLTSPTTGADGGSLVGRGGHG